MAEWKDLIDYEGQYMICDEGQIKSLKPRFFDRIMKARKDKDGYGVINLCRDGIKKTEKLHRLVALAFIPNPENLPEVNHKDGNKMNNAVSNLEWCTGLQNKQHAKTNHLIKRHKGILMKPRARILQLDLNGNIIKEYGKVIDAAKAVGTHNSNITMCLTGFKGRMTAGGFKWKREPLIKAS
jgi:hypothetical protein